MDVVVGGVVFAALIFYSYLVFCAGRTQAVKEIEERENAFREVIQPKGRDRFY